MEDNVFLVIEKWDGESSEVLGVFHTIEKAYEFCAKTLKDDIQRYPHWFDCVEQEIIIKTDGSALQDGEEIPDSISHYYGLMAEQTPRVPNHEYYVSTRRVH